MWNGCMSLVLIAICGAPPLMSWHSRQWRCA